MVGVTTLSYCMTCIGYMLNGFSFFSALSADIIIIHSIGMCRMWRFLAILRSFFHCSLLYTFSCHSSTPTVLLFPLTSSCHLIFGLPLSLHVSKFIYNTLVGILLSSILCTCPNQHNLCNLIVSVMMGFYHYYYYNNYYLNIYFMQNA
jgi:hypothetical protein